MVSAHVAGKAVESWDKGAGWREDKAGHSGMNIHRKRPNCIIMHAWQQNKEKTYSALYMHTAHKHSKKYRMKFNLILFPLIR